MDPMGILGMSSSQLTNSIIFQRGGPTWLNHQPVMPGSEIKVMILGCHLMSPKLSHLLAPHNVAKNHDPAKQSKAIVAMKIGMRIED
jgi:hypothetical protein